MKRVLLIFALSLIASGTALAGEIGYIEDFALAPDRTEPLKQLIPGTEDYYYYHCLHFQSTEQFDKVEELLKPWIERHKYTPRVRQIQNRQALLTYEKNPQQSLEFIRRQLGVEFNHQRETLGAKPNLPSELDQNLISRDTLTKIAFSRYKNLDGLEDSALDWLVDLELNPDQRRNLLERLQRPDYARLVQLLIDDLNHPYSKEFGTLAIHQQLLLNQLDDSLRLKPELLNQTNFVNIYLSKLRPSDDADWRNDLAEHEAYLDRLWSFVQTLAPVHNSLKAHVLYHRLTLDRSRGIYDKERFMEYIKLPRNVFYINQEYMKREESRRFPANLSQDFSAVTQMPIIGNDEPLVRSFLHHFFLKETTTRPYEPYINDVYLRHNLAETKIVNGLGEPEQWYSMLPPDKYQALKDRIDLDFAFDSKKIYGVDEPVALDVFVKNVKTLIVKLYEINTTSYYRDKLTEVNAGINLDGLVPNREETHQYPEPPLLRVKRHFEFPSLDKRGVYVIDFIGNGKSSRALIRKGKLHYLVRTSTAGQVFTVLDQSKRKLANATIWLSGQEYTAAEDGTITLPFSNEPGKQPLVLSHEGFSSLDQVQMQAENYALSAGIYVDREALLSRKTAEVLVRPMLFLNGTPVSLKPLEDVRLVLTSTDHDGVSTSKEVTGFELFEDRESAYEFQVPQRLASIQFTLNAKIQNLSQNKKLDLQVQESFGLNEIQRTDKIEDLHFQKVGGEYVLEVLGKSGEARPDRPINLALKARDFRNPVNVTLQSNAVGHVLLGALQGIESVTATSPDGVTHTWNPVRDQATYYQTLNAKVGDAVELPYLGSAEQPQRAELSLLELRGNTFVADRFEALSIGDGLLRVGKLPPGDYDLLLKEPGARVRLRLTEGEKLDTYVLGANRELEVRHDKPLQISRIETQDEKLVVALANASRFARVHVLATRYQPAYAAFAYLDVRDREPFMADVPKVLSVYLEGRNIGDEYRYIIDRKYARRFPGNMLDRPSVLLNPWAMRSTDTGQQVARGGEEFSAPAEDAARAYGGALGAERTIAPTGDFADLDFLSQVSAVLVNLEPDEKGLVTIPRSELGSHQQIHVVAVEPRGTVYRTVSLPQVEMDFLDLRLAKGLDPQKHFTQQKKISVVKADSKFVLPDITSSRFEAYDSLARVYGLYATLSKNPTLMEFGFILNWHKMKPEEKREKYSKYACHELNFFIYKKDPAFFREVVEPYLANKMHKTFMDRWLLSEDLQDQLKPWDHGRLNVLERILLAQRIQGEQQYTSRAVGDQFDLIPPDVDRFNYLFNTAVKGSALETTDVFELEKRQAGVTQLRVLQRQLAVSDEQAAKAAAKPAATAAPGMAGRAARPPAPVDAKGEKREELKQALEMANRAQLAETQAESMNALGRRSAARDRANYFADDATRRKEVQQFYRQLDKTQEWAENNYYQLPIEQQNAELITVNAFWRDYANHDPGQPFYSTNIAEASRNFPEMMLALALLDIPFEPAKHETAYEDTTMNLSAGSPMIVFHEEIREAGAMAEKTPILVSQNFFRHGDRYRYVNNEQQDKYVTDEFLVFAVYGCQIVVTNPTSAPQKLDLLLQVPVGAIPVLNGQNTRSAHVDLQPFNTQTIEYYFYFPAAGDFPHYPVQVAKNEQLLASAEPFTFHVVSEPSKIDRESWQYISQYGTGEEVLNYLKQHNLYRTDLEKIAFRMSDKDFFQQTIALLSQRHVYNNTLWSYGIKNDVPSAIREYLQHADQFLSQCGSYLDSPLVTIDPVVRKSYQHLDYRPLVNARAHQLGARRQIVNERLSEQYHKLLEILGYRRQLDDDDLMSVTYYMLLQDRIEEAMRFFGEVNSENLATRLQHDFFTAYLDFYREDPEAARQLATRYTDYPVDRWRNAFATVINQVDEIDSGVPAVVDPEDREQRQTSLAASAPSFDFKVEAKKVTINYQRLEQVRVNYYLMDIELLFSRNPFVQQYSGEFSYIQPNLTATVKLPADKEKFEFELPAELHNSNVLVEISGDGQTKTQAYYANSLVVQIIETYGQLRVTNHETGKPIPVTYVKVYAQMDDGSVRFYKDGYTDLRGRFDFTSLSTNELDHVRKFSLLVLSDQFGAVVREASPPQQ